MSKTAYIFLGPPGAGKGTQAKLVAEKLGVVHISTGDIVRQHIKNNPDAERIYNQGKILPDSLIMDWMDDEILKIKGDIVLDGMPRTVAQAEGFLTFFKQHNYKVKIFNININPQESIKRNVLRGRDEVDTEKKIKERLEVYKNISLPALELLGNKAININGEQAINKVHAEIWSHISPDNE